ncbi:hypothetical protein ARMSODRAFT_981855 [Armillaria solidipes]|uniref:Uncharacterized protein n=1 Tax=Armillaria solidipes TaxID=1076256 RepID=A0A2H3ATP2_9AGAR|nr:hypothetical protein ARMSODRAFT_981855 [Armillaria solidipes]
MESMDVDKDAHSEVLPSCGAGSTSEVSPSSESGSQLSATSEKDTENLPNDTDGDVDMDEQAGGGSGVDTPPNNSSFSLTETPNASDNPTPPPVSPEHQSPSSHPSPKPPIPQDDETRHILSIEMDILTGCPDWFATVYCTLGNNEFRDAFASLLWSWAFLEKKKEFTGPQVAFTAKERPELLSKWIGCGGKFQEEWSTWWRELQPSWREESPGGSWERGIYGDDWRGLSVSGQNGWLGVVACLFWWGNAVWATEDGDVSLWAEAVKDVDWILKGVLASIELNFVSRSPHVYVDRQHFEDVKEKRAEIYRTFLIMICITFTVW